MRRVAILSMHTSPLSQPGTGDGGGMNVYVRELAAALARRGTLAEVFTRADSDDVPAWVEVEPGFRVHYVPSGPLAAVPKHGLADLVEEFADVVEHRLDRLVAAEGAPVELLQANYWLSAMAGHVLKHRLGLPLVCTFHTLELVKAASGASDEPDGGRRRVEGEVAAIRCADAVLASSGVEASQLVELYRAPAARVRVLAPGVDHAVFGPGDRSFARKAIGLDTDRPVLLFVGRIQRAKGLELAVRTLGALPRSLGAVLVVVGGPSGADGRAEVERVSRLAERLGVASSLRWFAPEPHELLGSFYRAADVCLVPSMSESFGLVALEAAACGAPVVASAVGGLRAIVDHARTGFLVPERDPETWAGVVQRVLRSEELAERMRAAAVRRARWFTWRRAAGQLTELAQELQVRELVECR
jgi:D-inositol-3-phosphate glycosyltransferase